MAVPTHQRSRHAGAIDAAARSGAGPLVVAGCVLWLDASQITGLANSAAVATFADLSGNGNDYTQATSGNRPVYRVASAPALASVEFLGSSSQFMAAATRILPLTNCTLFLVVKPGSGNTGRLVGWANNGSGSNGVALIGSASDFWVIRNGGVSGDITGLGTAQGIRYLYSLRIGVGGTANSIARVNGVQKGTNTQTAWTSSGETAHLGCEGNVAEPWTGNVYEVIIYNTKLSDTDNALIEGYLNGKHTIY
jgi:large repetitive protein